MKIANTKNGRCSSTHNAHTHAHKIPKKMRTQDIHSRCGEFIIFAACSCSCCICSMFMCAMHVGYMKCKKKIRPKSEWVWPATFGIPKIADQINVIGGAASNVLKFSYHFWMFWNANVLAICHRHRHRHDRLICSLPVHMWIFVFYWPMWVQIRRYSVYLNKKKQI